MGIGCIGMVLGLIRYRVGEAVYYSMYMSFEGDLLGFGMDRSSIIVLTFYFISFQKKFERTPPLWHGERGYLVTQTACALKEYTFNTFEENKNTVSRRGKTTCTFFPRLAVLLVLPLPKTYVRGVCSLGHGDAVCPCARGSCRGA